MSAADRDPAADDRAWDDLVARLRGPVSGPLGPEEDDQRGSDEPVPCDGADQPSAAARRGPRDYELAEELDGELGEDAEWQPPDPGPVTAGLSTGTLLAWGLLVTLPVFLVVLGFVMNGLPWWLWVPGLAIMISAVLSLLGGLPEHHDDNDDGARV